MMIMNELDELLTREGLSTRIVFIAYVDTMFAPRAVRIQNPRRFSLLYAPNTRSYCSSITPDSRFPEPPEYRRNQWLVPRSAEENLAFLKDWQKSWQGSAFSYEYHFWKHQCFDLSGLYIARRIYEDIRSLRTVGLDGYVEDGSQRSFWPNGFAMYIYAETLMNRDCDFDAAAEDYFAHAYGNAGNQVLSLFRALRDVLDYAWVVGESHARPDPNKLRAELNALADRETALAQANWGMPYRVQTVSMKLLTRHAEYIRGLGDCFAQRAAGQTRAAAKSLEDFRIRFGAYETELERYFDHFLAFRALRQLIDSLPKLTEETV